VVWVVVMGGRLGGWKRRVGLVGLGTVPAGEPSGLHPSG